MPAEWEPHAATWLAWPHAEKTWPGCLEAAREEMAHLIEVLARSEPVELLACDADLAEQARKRIASFERADSVRVHVVPSDDVWLRDIGPTFVRVDDGGRLAIDWTFNAWGGKYPPWERDDAVAAQVAALRGIPCERAGLVAEGGALEVDGEGTLIACRATLLGPSRNPGLGIDELRARLRELIGVTQIVWLEAGIAGDDTDGHVDDVARFARAGVLVCAREPDPSDPNHGPLEDAAARLRGIRDAAGRPVRVIDLPMPEPLVADGERLPASYANFYIANRCVLVPGFGGPRDTAAVDVLRPLFPGREVVTVPARTLVRGLGSIHCLTQQEPVRFA